jgi:monoamine oxidase
MMMFQPVGGMDHIAYALAAKVGAGRLRFRTQVLSFADRHDGVEVDYRDEHGRIHRERADFCVAAMPPHLLARLHHNLGTPVQLALTRPQPLAVGKMGLEYGRRWWEEDERIFGGITTTDLDVEEIWHPSYGFFGARGVLLGYYNSGADARLYDAMTPRARVSRAVAQGVKIYGEKYRSELVSGFSVAWRRTPHIEGGWLSWPDSRIHEQVMTP